MSGYVKNVRIEVKFDGDDVVAILRPMSFADRLLIEDAYPEEGDSKEVRKAKSEALNLKMRDFLWPYLAEIDGLKDSQDEAISVETVLRDGYFSELVATIFVNWYLSRGPKNPLPPAASITDSSEPSRSALKNQTSDPAGSASSSGSNSGAPASNRQDSAATDATAGLTAAA